MIRQFVVKGLKEHLDIPVIRSNQTGEPPAYPYCSYTITTLASDNGGTWGKYDDGMERKPITQVWSVTVQSDDVAESMNLTLKAHEWFNRVGTVYLNDNGIIVQSVSNITNRDNLLTVEYEYRNGFDVVFWFLNEITDTAKATGYIESVDIASGLVEPLETDEEAIARLIKELNNANEIIDAQANELRELKERLERGDTDE